MKSLVFMFSLFVSTFGSSQELPNFLSKTEKKFVRNVINVQGSKPVEITKRKDNK